VRQRLYEKGKKKSSREKGKGSEKKRKKATPVSGKKKENLVCRIYQRRLYTLEEKLSTP